MLRVKAIIIIFLLATAHALCADLADLPSDVEELRYHLRLAPLRNTDVDARLYWNYTDSANYSALQFTVPALSSDDPIIGFIMPWTLINRSQGQDSILAEGSINSTYNSGSDRGLSAILSVSSTSSSIALGGARISGRIPMHFRRENPDSIGYYTSQPLKEVRNTARLVPRHTPGETHIKNIESLRECLSTSTDPAESFWAYLDRDTEPALAALGGMYDLATIREDDGSYSIIYLGGTRSAASSWPQFKVKGRLYPTIFTNHFTLVWVEPSGRLLDEELSADLELDGNILTLNFPLHRSKVRFRRVRQENNAKIP